MTKKDYIKIAEAIQKAREESQVCISEMEAAFSSTHYEMVDLCESRIIVNIANYFAEDNSRFDRAKFYTA